MISFAVVFGIDFSFCESFFVSRKLFLLVTLLIEVRSAVNKQKIFFSL